LASVFFSREIFRFLSCESLPLLAFFFFLTAISILPFASVIHIIYDYFLNVLDAAEFKQQQYHPVFPVATVTSKCCVNSRRYDLVCELVVFIVLCIYISHARSCIYLSNSRNTGCFLPTVYFYLSDEYAGLCWKSLSHYRIVRLAMVLYILQCKFSSGISSISREINVEFISLFCSHFPALYTCICFVLFSTMKCFHI
jgi:hypothetical protein